MTKRTPTLVVSCFLALLAPLASCVHQRFGESELPSVAAGPAEQMVSGPLSAEEREFIRGQAVASARTERSIVRLAQVALQRAGAPAGSATASEGGEIQGESDGSLHGEPGHGEMNQAHVGHRDGVQETDHHLMNGGGFHGDPDAMSDPYTQHNEGHGDSYEGEDAHHADKTSGDTGPHNDREWMHGSGVMGGPAGPTMGREGMPGGHEQMHGRSHGGGKPGGPDHGNRH